MTHYAVDPLIKRVQEWLSHIETLLPPGTLESTWELMGDSEMGMAILSSVDKLEKLSRSLSKDEIAELETLLTLVNIEPERVARNIRWVSTLGHRNTQN